MSKNDLIHFDGVIKKVLGGGILEVDCGKNKSGKDMILQGVLSGKIKKNKIKVILGDRVRISVSPYDLNHGLITFRYK